MSKRQICLYVQTHWDREWYWEFEKYRTQLLSVARRLIKELETGNLSVFHLDGQTCALEDILAVQPDLESKLKSLIASKRLRVGPWYVLADQMLVSGESLVRNLERGLRIASKYGDPLMVGYCPDTFGHTQDMPRILNGFGIDNAVVWRGVPKLDEGPEFYWRSPDGSQVLGYLLPDGYYQCAFQEVQHSDDQEICNAMLPYLLGFAGFDEHGKLLAELTGKAFSYCKRTSASLVPVGGDHLYPPVGLEPMLKSIREALSKLELDEDIEIKVTDLGEYLDVLKSKTPEHLELMRLMPGELRSNAASKEHCRAFMLAGVLSSRLYLKRDNRLLESRLFHKSEPLLSILFGLNLFKYPEAELDHAGKQLLLNHPHDSICGCSVDDVHNAMQDRSRSISQILDLLDRQIREELLSPAVHEWSPGKDVSVKSKESPSGFGRWQMDLNDPDDKIDGNIVFNLSASTVTAPVQFKFAMSAQELGLVCLGHKEEANLDAKQMKKLKSRLADFLDVNKPLQVEAVHKETEVFGAVGGLPVYKDVCYLEGYSLAEEIPATGAKVSLLGEVAQQSAELAGSRSGINPSASVGVDPGTLVCLTKDCLSNQYFRLHCDESGNIKVDIKDSQNQELNTFDLDMKFHDVGDAGDSYNFDPVFNDKTVEANFEKVSVLQEGPLVGSFELVHKIDIPDCIELSENGGIKLPEDVGHFCRSSQKLTHTIKTKVTIKACDPIIYFDCQWLNQSKDHRLEVSFSTGQKVEKTWSENHFSIVERVPLKHSIELPVAQGIEAPLDRFPCQRFFIANGQLFLNNGLPEYAVSDDRVSITLLRAFSLLSRKRMLTRGGGAGPYMPTPEGNCLGPNQVSFAWSPLALESKVVPNKLENSSIVRAYELAELYENPLWIAPISNQFNASLTRNLEGLGIEICASDVGTSVSAIEVENEAVRVSALYKIAGEKALMLRLLNVTEAKFETYLKVALSLNEIQQTNMAGKKLKIVAPEKGKYPIKFGKNELISLKLVLLEPN